MVTDPAGDLPEGHTPDSIASWDSLGADSVEGHQTLHRSSAVSLDCAVSGAWASWNSDAMPNK